MLKVNQTITVLLLCMMIGLNLAYASDLGERVLKNGTTGNDVKTLQVMLSEKGFNVGGVDGFFGKRTAQAVKEFQLAKNLKADGVVGKQTISTLLEKNYNNEVSKKDNVPANHKQAFSMVATAYAPGPHDNGKWGNLTHIGTQVRPGIIAVDPRVIPLRSKVYIQFADGSGMYAVAEDTGGAIKGNRIDLAKWTVAEAYKFGMQNVTVYLLD